VQNKRVLITAGAGGVGKTTTAAALGVAAARRGKRVLCLTIDPAKRLAESLGISEMRTEEAIVECSRFREAGIELSGSLTAMMLDTKRTFDELVRKHSSSPEKADRLLNNKLYQYVSTSLAGTQEYMAMEKLVAVKEDERYDLIVLDTPPTPNALDFLDAPQRLTEALDSTAMKWFVDAFESRGKKSLNVLARGAATLLRSIGRVTGGGFVEAVAEFIGELNELFGGFKARAARVEQALRGDEVAFVLVTSPSPPSIQEVLYFDERLKRASMPRGAFVVNRVHVPPSDQARSITAQEARAALDECGLAFDPAGQLGGDIAGRVAQAFGDAATIAALDTEHLKPLLQAATGQAPVVRIAERDTDVHDLRLLAELGEALMAGGLSV
jgi:anion-transporting  ArsA/GET3 family ATPase